MKMTANDTTILVIRSDADTSATASTVKIGAASVKNLTIRQLDLGFPKVRASLHGVRIAVEVRPSFDWSINLGGVQRSGSTEPAALSVDVFDSAVNFALPQGIQAVSVAELSLPDLALNSAEVSGNPQTKKLDLGRIIVETMKVTKVTTDDPEPPTVADVQLEKLEVNDVALGNDKHPVVLTSASVEKVIVEALPIPTLSISDIALPPVEGLPVSSKTIVVDGPIVERTVGDDDGSFRWHLRFKMMARLEIQELVLTLDTSISIGSIDLDRISLPITLEGLELGSATVQGISVANVTLGAS